MSQAAPSPPRRPGNKNKWFLAGALLAAAAGLAVITVGGIGENLVYYWGPTELAAAGERAIGANVRLGGLVAEGSVRRGSGVSGVEFDVLDRKGAKVHVKSSGVPPQMFRERIGVVVEGTMTRDGYFKGSRLMVSHGNEYRAPGEGEAVDVRKAMQSVRDEAETAAQ
ncbi:MAG TPA: cytochrome c maturation protein CcmE [Vicinamibacteria bacterium]|nr:cytochrome c maturation protein CcmE [Vicinamibacteria bacterium]